MSKKLITGALLLSLAACTTTPNRDLASFKTGAGAQCYDRDKEPYTMVVDAHMHPKPFGGAAVPYSEMQEYFDNTGVRFAVYFGIGQIIEMDSTCTYYLDCQGTKALPSIKNDFANGLEYDIYRDTADEVPTETILSMSFMDLAHPEDAAETIALYDKEYPGMFKWAGELNVIKQALLGNGHEPATFDSINEWASFMKILEERGIPATLHSDLGNNDEPAKYVELMDHILKTYPNNKIVWAHMGLSKELTNMSPDEHIKILKAALDKAPNLMLDTSWRVLYDTYFINPEYLKKYIVFMNEYSDRILNGTDFVASRAKTYKTYREELEVVSRFHKDLDDDAFRNIALGENFFRLMDLDYTAPSICN